MLKRLIKNIVKKFSSDYKVEDLAQDKAVKKHPFMKTMDETERDNVLEVKGKFEKAPEIDFQELGKRIRKYTEDKYLDTMDGLSKSIYHKLKEYPSGEYRRTSQVCKHTGDLESVTYIFFSSRISIKLVHPYHMAKKGVVIFKEGYPMVLSPSTKKDLERVLFDAVKRQDCIEEQKLAELIGGSLEEK
jgi:hypothetical protein